jgi:type II secretory pathway pseudopilin PulG
VHTLFSRPRQRPLSQTGDTIVEVLIAIAIISLVLTGAFSTTHKSLAATRSSQEHSEALKLLESQIENIRSYAIYPATTNPAEPFCVNPAVTPQLVKFGPAVTIPASANNDSLATPPYPTNCQLPSSGGAYNYYVSAVYDSTAKVYDLRARWNALGGTGNNQVELFYRYTKPVALAAALPACTYLPQSGLKGIRNGDFLSGNSGFTSILPYRGFNVYPSDPLGGFAIESRPLYVKNSGSVDYTGTNGPYNVNGIPWQDDPALQLPASGGHGADGTGPGDYANYFYSNPYTYADLAKNGSITPTNTAKGDVWAETGIQVDSGKQYQLTAEFFNLKITPTASPAGQPPKITLFKDEGNPALEERSGQTPVLRTPTPKWQQLTLYFTTKASENLIDLSIRDDTGSSYDDDFGLTGVKLNECL